MKNFIFSILFLCFSAIVYGQTPCDVYYPLPEGEELVMISYNKKDKVDGYSVMNVKDKSSSSVLFMMEYYDEKGKDVMNSEFEITCEDDKMWIDMSNMVPAETMAGMEGMEVKMEGDMLEFPQSFSVGQTLPDGEIEISAEMNGMSVMNLKLNITDRKVEEMVAVTTSLGTFDCYKMVQTSKMKFSFMNVETKSEDYWCPGVGLIKSIQYDKKGNLDSYTIRGKRTDIGTK